MLSLKVAKESEKFASVAEFADLTHDWVGRLHKEFTRSFPGRVTKLVAKADSPAEARKIIKEEAQKIFDDFRENPKKYIGDAK